MTDVTLDNIFMIPIIDQSLNRAALEATVYLYSIEHGLRSASYNEYIVLHLRKYFFCNFYVYVVLFHYPVGKRFKDLALRNWNLLKTNILFELQFKLEKA